MYGSSVGSGKKYHDELPSEFAKSLWKQEEIRPLQLMRIVAWKSQRALAELTVNDENEILDRTHNAISAIRHLVDLNVVTAKAVDWQVWRDAAANAIGVKKSGTGLLGLRGVSYPVATAILAILLPDVFPVMDRFAISSAFGITVKEGKSPRFHKADKYREYCERLVSSDMAGVKEITSIHKRDQFFMNLAMKTAS